jgi:hypothetical protein
MYHGSTILLCVTIFVIHKQCLIRAHCSIVTVSLPAFTYQFVHKVQNRNVLLIAGKTCNKLPTFGRKKDAMLLPAYGRNKCLQVCRPTAGYKVCNFSARLPGKAGGQGCQTRLPDKSAEEGFRTSVPDKTACNSAIWWKHGEIGRKWSILTNVSPRRRRTTKQNLDPRCTYQPTQAKIGINYQ